MMSLLGFLTDIGTTALLTFYIVYILDKLKDFLK